jgi:hypothetical protein
MTKVTIIPIVWRIYVKNRIIKMCKRLKTKKGLDL